MQGFLLSSDIIQNMRRWLMIPWKLFNRYGAGLKIWFHDVEAKYYCSHHSLFLSVHVLQITDKLTCTN